MEVEEEEEDGWWWWRGEMTERGESQSVTERCVITGRVVTVPLSGGD